MKNYIKTAKIYNDEKTILSLTEELNGVEEPEIQDPRARRLRTIFSRLSLRRTSGMNGPEPIQPTEMKAWLELNNISLTEWEIALIEKLDIELLSSIRDKKES